MRRGDFGLGRIESDQTLGIDGCGGTPGDGGNVLNPCFELERLERGHVVDVDKDAWRGPLLPLFVQLRHVTHIVKTVQVGMNHGGLGGYRHHRHALYHRRLLGKGHVQGNVHRRQKGIHRRLGPIVQLLVIIDKAARHDKLVGPCLTNRAGLDQRIRRRRRPFEAILSGQHGTIGQGLLVGRTLYLDGQGRRGPRRLGRVEPGLNVEQGAGIHIEVEFGGDNVRLVVIANLGPVNVDGLDRVAGIGDEEPHPKHVGRHAIVAPGRSELVLKGGEVPGPGLDGLGIDDPGVLGIGPRPEKLYIPRPSFTLVPPKKGKEFVLHRDTVEIAECRITVNVGVGENHNRVGRDLFERVAQEIRIGEAMANHLLGHLVRVAHRGPLIGQVGLVQKDDPVERVAEEIVLEALADFLGPLGHGMDEILGEKPEGGRGQRGLGPNAESRQTQEAFFGKGGLRHQKTKMENQADAGHHVPEKGLTGLSYNRELLVELVGDADVEAEGGPALLGKGGGDGLRHKELGGLGPQGPEEV